MSCGSRLNLPLVRNQQLRSAQDGGAKTYWSPSVSYEQAAINIRLLILTLDNASIRFRGRYSFDGGTWFEASPQTSPVLSGFIDGLTSPISSLGAASFQYIGLPIEHTPFFQIGIEVTGAGSAVGSVTLSAEAVIGPAQVVSVSLEPASGTLIGATIPLIVTGAKTIRTAGASRVRVEMGFATAIGTNFGLVLATGPTETNLYLDMMSRVNVSAAEASTTISFVVDAPDLFSTVYYVAGGTTPTVTRLILTLIP